MRLQRATGLGLRFHNLGVLSLARHRGLWFGGAFGRWVPLPSLRLVSRRREPGWQTTAAASILRPQHAVSVDILACTMCVLKPLAILRPWYATSKHILQCKTCRFGTCQVPGAMLLRWWQQTTISAFLSRMQGWPRSRPWPVTDPQVRVLLPSASGGLAAAFLAGYVLRMAASPGFVVRHLEVGPGAWPWATVLSGEEVPLLLQAAHVVMCV